MINITDPFPLCGNVSINTEDIMKDKAIHLKALEAIVSKENIFSDPIDCFGYSYDASPEELNPAEAPDFVCKVHNVHEVSAISVSYTHLTLPTTSRV